MYKFPMAGIARTIWGNHEDIGTYFRLPQHSTFSGDGALRETR